MKTFSFSKFKVPTPDEIVSGLDLATAAPVIAARQAVEAARQALDRARQQADAALRAIEPLRERVATQQAPVSALEDALRARDAHALVIPPHERRLADAEARLTVAQREATAAIIAEAERRRDELQAVADQVAPLLDHLKECEGRLDQAVRRVGASCVTALVWPDTLDTDYAIGGARGAALAVGTGHVAR